MCIRDRYVPDQPLYSPVQGTLTSGYGYRDNPVNGQEDFHAGLDIAVAEGTPVHCALAGQVVQAGFNRIRGNYIMVRLSLIHISSVWPCALLSQAGLATLSTA